MLVPFLGFVIAIASMWLFGWMGWLYLLLMVVGWFLSGLGITVGFHRLLSHRAFDTYRLVRAFWTILGAVAAQGPPLTWCATHRKHHEHSDKAGDPHSPHRYGAGCWNIFRGLAHAHIGWIFDNRTNDRLIRRYVPDLQKDDLLVSIERTYPLWVLVGLAIPAAIGLFATGSMQGAFLGFLWGGLARVFVVHHVTWSINSICHTFGRRDFDSDDCSRNNFIFGLLGHGEGWHNNHHAFPNSARHGFDWWQIDVSWLVIRALWNCHLAWNVRTPSQLAMKAKRLIAD